MPLRVAQEDKESRTVPPPPHGLRTWQVISVSLVVADATISTRRGALDVLDEQQVEKYEKVQKEIG